MAKFSLRPDDVVESADYDIQISLKRHLKGAYGDDELGRISFRIPLGNEATVSVPEAMRALRNAFEDQYGAVIPVAAPVILAEPEKPIDLRGSDVLADQ